MTPHSAANAVARVDAVREMLAGATSTTDPSTLLAPIADAVQPVVQALSSGTGSPVLEFIDEEVDQEPAPMGTPVAPRYPDGVSTDLGEGLYRTVLPDGSVIVDYPVENPYDEDRILHVILDGPDETANLITVRPGRADIIFNRRVEVPGGYIFEPGDTASVDQYGNVFAGRAPDFDLSGMGGLLLGGATRIGGLLGKVWKRRSGSPSGESSKQPGTKPEGSAPELSVRAEVAPGKFDYMFGRVKPDDHNSPRAAQNREQLSRVGVYDNQAGRDMLQDHFNQVVATDDNILRTYTDEYGEFQVRESLFAGPNGLLKFETTWQVVPGGYRLTTIIPKGKK